MTSISVSLRFRLRFRFVLYSEKRVDIKVVESVTISTHFGHAKNWIKMDVYGETPLFRAQKMGHTDVVYMLKNVMLDVLIDAMTDLT